MNKLWSNLKLLLEERDSSFVFFLEVYRLLP